MAMSKEDQYKVAMIVCASVAGALLILLLLTWWCCCMYYERRRIATTHVVKPRVRTQQEVVRWDVAPYEGWGQPAQPVSSSCGCGAPASGSGGCSACDRYAKASAYDWMAPKSSGAVLNVPSNVYNPTPVQTTGGEYGRVLLNPPTGVCNKPSIPSAQYAGQCSTGNCHGTAAVNSTGHLTSNVVNGSGAQFILESANKY